jgi:hypothetical protein
LAASVALAACAPSGPRTGVMPEGEFKSIEIELPQPYLGYETVPGYVFMMPTSPDLTRAHVDSVFKAQGLEVNGTFPGGWVASSPNTSRCTAGLGEVSCRIAYVILYRQQGAQTQMSVGALEVLSNSLPAPTSKGAAVQDQIRDAGAAARLVEPAGRNWLGVKKLVTAIYNEIPATK